MSGNQPTCAIAQEPASTDVIQRRRVIAASVRRLRGYLAIGGQPYIRSDGNLAISYRSPTMWGKGDEARRTATEKANNRFLDALVNDDARRCIIRAIRVVGTRRPNGAIVIGARQ